MSVDQQLSIVVRDQSAVALNNIGVGLLERHCYEQASETLKDAGSLMKWALLGSKRAEELTSNVSQRKLYTNLTPTHFMHENDLSKQHALLMDVLTFSEEGLLSKDDVKQQTPLVCLETILESCPSSTIAFPIRLEENVFLEASLSWNHGCKDSKMTMSSFYSQAAIVFHNLGISYQCQSKIARRKEAHKLRSAAIYYSRVSYEILDRQYSALPTLQFLSNTFTDVHGTRTTGLIMVVLNSLIQHSHESEQHERACNFYSFLVQTRNTALQLIQSRVATKNQLVITAPAA